MAYFKEKTLIKGDLEVKGQVLITEGYKSGLIYYSNGESLEDISITGQIPFNEYININYCQDFSYTSNGDITFLKEGYYLINIVFSQEEQGKGLHIKLKNDKETTVLGPLNDIAASAPMLSNCGINFSWVLPFKKYDTIAIESSSGIKINHESSGGYLVSIVKIGELE